MTDVILGSHTRTYEFKRVEEQSFFIAVRGGGGEEGRRERGREILFASLKSADSY